MHFMRFYLSVNVIFTHEEQKLKDFNNRSRRSLKNQFESLHNNLGIGEYPDSAQFNNFQNTFYYFLNRQFPEINDEFRFQILSTTETSFTLHEFGNISNISIPLDKSKSEAVELIKAKVTEVINTITVGNISQFCFCNEDRSVTFETLKSFLEYLGLE
jgi:hypothetical protein